ncbi:monosaccharide ABC transporter substrate-binding protein (CUT2 family) [Hydrogenoanaerobacterium saccharovorans]|uniref:Monosaccharide ABC transporter substrate-binding protein, CUT2 family n=1 Tax=Hydrogenoanaerobacterium saccharovorans TaxID=474960 RepID=A0A1H7YMD9_9FIRM|nr:ABC transporter substrate-binding protein [Hydrogenoanaerobacterium saccharovorans]RPF49121.1 monosaccharide ABC transporter substrate-binding protein (CUT2 family) [Hydrogenoanaerobacterium saccharovorans]SEM47402.1 monosaccharide ABC transporter substrate-binding protein, CUT2 family [Hydrogenoanaerobacterium saccharovorans]
MKKSIGILLALVLVVSMFAGCGSKPAPSSAAPADSSSAAPSEATAKETIKIALVTKMVDSPYWQTVKRAAEEKAKELGNVEVTHLGPPTEADIDKQVQIIETCINDDYDGIILAACDKDALIAPVQKAKDAGIPVVMIDSGISEPVYDAFLATNNVQAGAECAKLMSDLIGNKGKVAIVNFAAGTQTAIDRETGFTEEIKNNHKDVEIVGVQYCDSDPTKAANQATDFITANPDIKGIWGANDQSAVGVAQAVTEKGKGDSIMVVGFDNSDDIKAGLKSGTIKGTAVQMPTMMGSMGVQIVVDILGGKAPAEKDVDTGVTMVTFENYTRPAMDVILNQ